MSTRASAVTVAMGLWVLAATGCDQFADPMTRALVVSADADHVVWAFRSPDPTSFGPVGDPIAWGLNGLGLAVADDGDLLLTGIRSLGQPSLVERFWTGPVVHGLRFDGQSWTPAHWDVNDPDAVSYIDPQIFEEQLWYVAPRGRDGDPAARGRLNPVRSSPPPQTRFEGPQVVDPSPVRFLGQLHLFVTQDAAIAHLSGDPLTLRHQLPGATVPFAIEEEDHILLLGQAMSAGRRQPVLARLGPGELSAQPTTMKIEWRTILDMGSLGSCTSPVLGPDPRGGWLLLCVEERLGEQVGKGPKNPPLPKPPLQPPLKPPLQPPLNPLPRADPL